MDTPSGPLTPYLYPSLQPLWVPTLAVLIYVVVIFGGQWYMRDKPKIETPWLLFWHNIILTVISVILAAGGLYTAIFIGRKYSLYDMYCGVSIEVDGPLLNWGNYFYLSKYYELFDTVFLVLRKRDLTVLHLFHHIVVVFTCWFAVHEHQIMGWITCVNNASVHVIMYWYFAFMAIGTKFSPTFKKMLTTTQMIQFVVDIVTSIPFLYLWAVGAPCRGSIWSWINAVIVGALLWLLFNNFFQKNYNNKGGAVRRSGSQSPGDSAGEKTAPVKRSASKKDN